MLRKFIQCLVRLHSNGVVGLKYGNSPATTSIKGTSLWATWYAFCAMVIERVIPMNRLLGLIVTNVDDANLLKRKLRTKLRLDVDLFTRKNVVSVHSLSQPLRFWESLKSHRIVGYLADKLQCPDIIKSFCPWMC